MLVNDAPDQVRHGYSKSLGFHFEELELRLGEHNGLLSGSHEENISTRTRDVNPKTKRAANPTLLREGEVCAAEDVQTMTITVIGQTSINITQAPAVAGDFASTNPRHSALTAVDGAFQAGTNGCTIGLFAWIDSSGAYLSNTGSGTPNAFIARTQEALITTYAGPYGNTIPAGFPVGNAFDEGDFWVANAGSTLSAPGMKAFANLSTGAATFGWSGSASAALSAAASAVNASIVAGTPASSVTSTISGNVLTTSAVVTNTIYPGAVVSGGTVATGTYIVSQVTPLLSGEATGGAGRYIVSIPDQTVTSATLTFTQSVYTPGSMQAGTVTVGSMIVASGSTYTTTAATTGAIVGMVVMAAISGSTWSLAPAAGQVAAGTLSSGTVVTAANVETKWYAKSSGALNELVKITNTI